MSRHPILLVMAVAIVALAGCKKKKMQIESDDRFTIRFGAGDPGERWIGKPVRVESRTRELTQLGFMPTQFFDPECAAITGFDRPVDFVASLNAGALRNSFESELLGSFWKTVLATKWIVTASCNDEKAWSASADTLFPKTTNHAKLFKQLRSALCRPGLVLSSEVKSHLMYSSTDWGVGGTASIPEAVKVGTRYEDKTTYFQLDLQVGQIRLGDGAERCLSAAAARLPSRPTHIVSALNVGVLVQMKLEESTVEFAAGPTPAVLDVAIAVDQSDVSATAFASGEVPPDVDKLVAMLKSDKSPDFAKALSDVRAQLRTFSFPSGRLQPLGPGEECKRPIGCLAEAWDEANCVCSECRFRAEELGSVRLGRNSRGFDVACTLMRPGAPVRVRATGRLSGANSQHTPQWTGVRLATQSHPCSGNLPSCYREFAFGPPNEYDLAANVEVVGGSREVRAWMETTFCEAPWNNVCSFAPASSIDIREVRNR